MTQVFCHRSSATAHGPADSGNGGRPPPLRALPGDGCHFDSHLDFSFMPLVRCRSLKEMPENTFALEECPQLARKSSDTQWILPGCTASRAVGRVPAVRGEPALLLVEGEHNIANPDRIAYSRFFPSQHSCRYSGNSVQILSTAIPSSNPPFSSVTGGGGGTLGLTLKGPSPISSPRGAIAEAVGATPHERASGGGGNLPVRVLRYAPPTHTGDLEAPEPPGSAAGQEQCANTVRERNLLFPGILSSPQAPSTPSEGEMGTSVAFDSFVSWWGKGRCADGERTSCVASIVPPPPSHALGSGAALAPDYKDNTVNAYLRQNYGSPDPVLFAPAEYSKERGSGPCHALSNTRPFGRLFDSPDAKRRSTPWPEGRQPAADLACNAQVTGSAAALTGTPDLDGLYAYYISRTAASGGTPDGNNLPSPGVLLSERPTGGLRVTTRLLRPFQKPSNEFANPASAPPLNTQPPCREAHVAGDTVAKPLLTSLRKVFRTEAAEVLASTGTYEGRRVVVEKTPAPNGSAPAGSRTGTRRSAEAASANTSSASLVSPRGLIRAQRRPQECVVAGNSATSVVPSILLPAHVGFRESDARAGAATARVSTETLRRLGSQGVHAVCTPVVPALVMRNSPDAPSESATPVRGTSSETTASTASVSSALTRSVRARTSVVSCAIKPSPRMPRTPVPVYSVSTRKERQEVDAPARVPIDTSQQSQAVTHEPMIRQVWRVSLCGKKTELAESKHVLGTRGQKESAWNRDAARVLEHEHHREFVFYFPSKEVISRDDLTIISAISQGSFGTVYRCQWKDRIVAVKQAHGPLVLEAMRSVAREVNSFRALGEHPSIVRYFGVCLNPHFLGIVMEYLPGTSVFDMLYHHHAYVQAERRLSLCRQLVRAVHYMHHEKRLVHRDLKTANLILQGTDGLKLCDFGKTRSMGADGKLLLDDNGGSPRYMAPECFLVGNVVDEKADIWGLACCLVEILGGPIPFEEIQTNEAVIDALLCKKLRPMVPSWFHPTAQRLLTRCFAHSPRDRPSTTEVAQTLDFLTASDLNLYGMHTRRTK